jgi:aminopeptidase N
MQSPRNRVALLCSAFLLGGHASPDRSTAAARAPAAAPVARAAVTTAPEAIPQPGAAGIGDPFFGEAGNGGYDVERYDLSFSLDDPEGPITAVAELRATSTQALSSFHLDLHGLEVREVTVDGEIARFERDGDELVISPAAAIPDRTPFAVRVSYDGVPEGVADETLPIPVDIGWMTHDGEAYVFSQPNGAKSFFPCNDHPRDKALFTLRVDVPEPLEVVSNGALAERIDSGGRRTYVWKPRDPMATYLVTLAIGEFDEEVLQGPGGLPITNYFTRKSTERQRRDFAQTPEIVAFLSESFGPYPFESCGNILSNLRLPAALETQTIPVYGQGANDDSIICHELAHQWFGDSVSVVAWDDIWLNEGFAEYAAWMYRESREGAEAFERHLRLNYGLAKAFEAPPPGHVDPDTMFGAAVYVRGPLALHALRAVIGTERFLDLIRSWVANHANGNASLEQFLEHLERSTTPEAVAAIEPWLFDEEMPSVPAWDEVIEAERKAREERRRQRDEERRKRDEERQRKKDEADAKKDGEGVR